MGSYGLIISSLISLGFTAWFVVFTVLVLKKLGRIVELLSNKQ